MSLGTGDTAIRDMLRSALQGRALANDPLSYSNAHAERLSQVEKSALLQLYNWAHDSELRRTSPPLQQYGERRLVTLLEAIEPKN